MQRRIVVPLDGSALADRILAQVRRLLVAQDVHVSLLSVVPAYLDDAARARLKQEARQHLERVRDALVEQGATASVDVLEGDPAEQIALHATRIGAALVVMSTHGRTGLSRLVRGSVAEEVLRACPAPVLVANPQAVDARSADGELRFARLLVPLDGSEEATQVLPLVEGIARRYQAEVLLLQADWLPVQSVEGPFVVPSLIRSHEQVAAALEPVRARLAARGVRVRVLSGTNPAAVEIVDAAEREQVDLVVMSTHGRTGASRWVYGSVAEQVLRHCTRPLLVRRVQAGAPGSGATPPAAVTAP